MAAPLIREVTAKSALNKTGGFLSGYTHSLNPYSGCQFGADLPRLGPDARGCPYCYVRELPFVRFRGEPWGGWVDVKLNLPDVLAAELATLRNRGRLAETRIFCGSATDPYQPIAEDRYQITRRAIEALIACPPGGFLLQSRSTLVRRDLEPLARLSRVTNLIVSITVETDDETVRRQVTPTSPPIAARIALLGDLRAAGVPTRAAISPLLPGNAERLAELLDPVVDRVVLDTFQLGDGSGGRRSDRLGMAGVLARLGYAEWYAPDAYRPVLTVLRRRLGADRVGLSAAGFNLPAAEPAARPPAGGSGSPARHPVDDA